MIHAVQLRNGLVAFVDQDQRIVRQIIEQGGRRFARQASRKMPRVILDPVAIADLLHHFQIEHGALPQALRLDQLALLLQFLVPPIQLGQDAGHCRIAGLLRHHVVRLRINRQPLISLPHLSQQRVDLRQAFDLVAEHLDAIGVVIVSGIDLDDVAAHPESAAPEIGVVPVVQDIHQARDNLVAGNLLPFLEHQQHAVVSFGRAQTVYATHAGHDHAVAPLE